MVKYMRVTIDLLEGGSDCRSRDKKSRAFSEDTRRCALPPHRCQKGWGEVELGEKEIRSRVRRPLLCVAGARLGATCWEGCLDLVARQGFRRERKEQKNGKGTWRDFGETRRLTYVR